MKRNILIVALSFAGVASTQCTLPERVVDVAEETTQVQDTVVSENAEATNNVSQQADAQ